jgi:hypothetical protein
LEPTGPLREERRERHCDSGSYRSPQTRDRNGLGRNSCVRRGVSACLRVRCQPNRRPGTASHRNRARRPRVDLASASAASPRRREFRSNIRRISRPLAGRRPAAASPFLPDRRRPKSSLRSPMNWRMKSFTGTTAAAAPRAESVHVGVLWFLVLLVFGTQFHRSLS